MGKKKPSNPHRWANPELNRAMHGLGSSNAAQPHVPTPKKGTRSAQDRRAIREQVRDRAE